MRRCERWTLQGLLTMVLWWTPYHLGFRGSRSTVSDAFFFFSWNPSQRLSLQNVALCGLGIHTRCTSAFEVILFRCVGAHTNLVQRSWLWYGPSDDLCCIRTVWLWWTPYHQDQRGSLWQVMVGMVEAIHKCFCDGATHRLRHRNNNIWHGAVPWWTHTTLPGFLEDTYFHTSLVDMEFSCLRRGASDDHCDTHLLPWHLQDVCSEFLFYMLAFCSVVLIV